MSTKYLAKIESGNFREITIEAFREEMRALTAIRVTHVVYEPFKDKYKKPPPEVEYLPYFLDNPEGN